MLQKHELIEQGLVSKKTNAVYDHQFNLILRELPWRQWYEEDGDPLNCRFEYLQAYKDYLSRMKLNEFHGLEQFQQMHLINGTTQTFDEAYYKYKERRLRLLKGEYAYHKRVVNNWKFIEESPIEQGDYLIISVPHCTTGDVPVDFYKILDRAYEKKAPVIIDAAYVGTCYDVKVDLKHPAIESVSFSLTKGTGLGRIRSGVRFSNIDDDLPICQQNRYDHHVLAAAKIGLYMMRKLETPDYIPLKFKNHQLSACQEAGIAPTNCVHLALGDEAWSDFNVDGYYRLGIRNLVKARYQGKI